METTVTFNVLDKGLREFTFAEFEARCIERAKYRHSECKSTRDIDWLVESTKRIAKQRWAVLVEEQKTIKLPPLMSW